MSERRMVLEIAQWEFRRWFKPWERVRAVLLAGITGLLLWGGLHLVEKWSAEEARIAVVGGEELARERSPPAGVRFVTEAGLTREEALRRLEKGELEAVLDLSSAAGASLTVRREPAYLEELSRALAQSRRQAVLRSFRLGEEQLADLDRPYQVEVLYHEGGVRPRTLGDKIAAGVLVGLMILGVYIGLSYQFIVITGEKRLRVTEQVISAVSPQTWIDGKILGVSLLAFVSLLTYVLATLVFFVVGGLVGRPVALPPIAFSPSLWLVVSLLCLGGFFLWNTFFAAVSASVSDPETSSKGSLLMLPALPLAFGFLALRYPDALPIRVLSWIPVTSPTVLASRLMLTEVALWEIALSLVLLWGTAWGLRRMAGKVFATTILMYGKEPTLREMWRWARQT